ncbi:MAG TPA: tyrosine-type recombinase/integrase [Anaeromyxobacteraceae bacterium]|jgi:integrase|nr:tyrosine-type recombinase/integrase [Anaeromyxobacteraceae bacterium]
MSSVYRKQRRWWIRYKDVAGRWKDIPTKADTKALAKLLAHDLEHKIERQRLGLDPILTIKIVTFGKLMDDWWAEHENLLRSKTIQPFADKHLRRAFGDLVLGDITSGKLEQLFNAKLAELSPQSINHLRSYVRRIFNYASRREMWNGANPASLVKKYRVTKKKPEYLRPHEVGKVLIALAPKWRSLFATAFFTGLRKGELLALLKTDVDLESRAIKVHRSNAEETTKGDHEDMIPVAEELLPYLVEAVKQSKSELLFSKSDGTQYPADLALHLVLRRAMGRAGIVQGYNHKCRRKGCGFQEKRQDAAESKCPRCSMKLWVKPIPRPTRFHDTRHTTATLLLKAGVPLAVVQKVLRHTDPAITAGVYGHLDMGDMLKAVNTLGSTVHPHLQLISGVSGNTGGKVSNNISGEADRNIGEKASGEVIKPAMALKPVP